LFNDWYLTLSYLTGNEADYGLPHDNVTEIYFSLEGTIIDNFEAQLIGKFFRDAEDIDGKEPINTITFQTLFRYRFHEKFAAGISFSYLAEDESGWIFNPWIYNPPNPENPTKPPIPGKHSGIDLGIVCEYNPTPFIYLRLEGGMLSLSNSVNDDYAKIFSNGDKDIATRLNAAFSMGFRLGNLFKPKK
jgi:hypothetical protein